MASTAFPRRNVSVSTQHTVEHTHTQREGSETERKIGQHTDSAIGLKVRYIIQRDSGDY
jgi:hypothetical protein